MILAFIFLVCGLVAGWIWGCAARDASVRVLHLLHRSACVGPLRADQIARHTACTRRRVYFVLAQLEESGFVERSPDTSITNQELAARGGIGRSVWRVKG